MADEDALSARLLAAVRRHLEAEASRDVPATLSTITEDCRYEFPWQDLVIDGSASLARYYEMLFASRPGPTLAPNIRRYWISGDDTVIIELAIRYQVSDDAVAEALLMSVFTVRGDRLSGEMIYVVDHQEWVDEWRAQQPTTVMQS